MMPSYAAVPIGDLNSKFEVVDLRSDTVSHPTEAMKKAMVNAIVGDDVYGEDPTAKSLELRAAQLFQKEAAIFLPSGTMGNVIAVLAHCDRRGCELICGDQSHVFLYEQGAAAQLGSVHSRAIPNLPDGTFDLKVLIASIRGNDIHSPITGLITIENTHNMCGGKVLPLSWISDLVSITKKYGIPVHMDGARIFNAAIALNVPVAKICEGMDSVQFCFSKGLGTPAGCMLIGTTDFIQRARRLRKVLGGAMRQVGYLAAPCHVALDSMIDRLAEDHKRTRAIAEAINKLNSPTLKVDVDGVHTNILMVHLLPEVMSSTLFCTRLSSVSDEEEKEFGDEAIFLRISPKNDRCVRIVVYWEITDKQVEKVIKKIEFIVKELEKRHTG